MYKRIIAALMSVTIVITLAACHAKNESVVDFGGVPNSDATATDKNASATVMTLTDVKNDQKTTLSIPSGLYLLFQTYAFSNFVSEVDKVINGEYSVTAYNKYMEYSLDGKSADQWIKEKTMEYVKKYAATEALYNISELSFGTAESSTVASAAANWQNNYGDTYEKNGVGKSSYKLYYSNYLKEAQLFAYYYDAENSTTGLGGIFEVSDEELKDTLADNFIIEQQLSVSTKDDNGENLSDAKIKAIKTRLDGYASKINSGKTTFDKVKATEDKSSSTAATSAPANDKGVKSIYPSTVTLLSSNDSDATNYNKFKAMYDGKEGFKFNKAIVTGGKDDGSYYLTIIYDIAKDYKYYTHYTTTQYDQSTGQSYNVSLHSQLLNLYKWDSFEDMLIKTAEGFDTQTNQDLVDYYSPDKISFDTEEQ